MAIGTTYARLRDNLATVLNQVADDREVVIVRRRGAPDVALIPAEELTSLMETAHLLRSPANAKRLLRARRRVAVRRG
jgi:antitoxin YefM